MRQCSTLLCLILSGCAFDGRSAPQDGNVRLNDSVVTGDATVQGPARVVAGLVARWDFNRLDNGVVKDLTDSPADLIASSTSNFVIVQENGTGAGIRSGSENSLSSWALQASSITKFQSKCTTAKSYTFEIWTQSGPNMELNNVMWLGDTKYGNLRLQSGGTQNRVASRTKMLNQDSAKQPILPVIKTQTILRMGNGVLEFILDGVPQHNINSSPPPSAWLMAQDLYFFHGPKNQDNTTNDWSGTIYLAAFYCSYLTDDELALHRMLGSEAR
jgi:hypothetical protein